jgi:hypothetical protein
MNGQRNVRYKFLQKRLGNPRTVVDDDSAAQFAVIGRGDRSCRPTLAFDFRFVAILL